MDVIHCYILCFQTNTEYLFQIRLIFFPPMRIPLQTICDLGISMSAIVQLSKIASSICCQTNFRCVLAFIFFPISSPEHGERTKDQDEEVKN